MEPLDSDTPNYDFSSLRSDNLGDGENLGDDFLHRAGTNGESLPTMDTDSQEYVDLNPCRQERLMKEAEGLFVGVNLLNEMDPLEDMDMPDPSQELSAETLATLSDLLSPQVVSYLFPDLMSSYWPDVTPRNIPSEISYNWLPDWWNTHIQESLDAEIKKTNLEIYGEQLNVLRVLRAKFIVHHRRFLQKTANEPSEKIQGLRRSCRRYKDLLDVGLLTFKAIMAGEQPTSLKEVVAFISLSYAMVCTMQARGKPVDFCLDENEVKKWLECITNWHDRLTLSKLIPLLWPEMKTSSPIENLSSDSAFPAWDRYYYDAASPTSIFYPDTDNSLLHSTAHRLLGETSADNDFCFSDWLNLVPMDDTNSSQDSSFSEKFLQTNPLSDPSSQECLTSSRSDVEKTDWPGGTNKPEQINSLAQTTLFMQAIAFLIFIGSLGILLFCLSVDSQTISSTGTHTFTTVNTARFARFLEVAKYRILNPLCLDVSLSDFHPLFRTTAKVLESGWLRTVRDIETYLLDITKLFAKCQLSYLSAVSKILACALNASQDERIDHEHLYRDGHQEINDYTAEYILKRTNEVAAIFTDEVANLAQYETRFGNTNAGMNDDNELLVEAQMADPESFNQELASAQSAENQSKSLSPSMAATSIISPASQFHSSDNTIPSPPSPATQATTQSQPITLHCPFSDCSKKYTGPDSRSNLARHKREQHSSRAAFACTAPTCRHVSKRLHNLRVHWRLRHGSLTMPEWLGRGRGRVE